MTAPRTRRLGVSAALVDGELLAGDVSVSGSSVEAVGLGPRGSTGVESTAAGAKASGIAIPGLVDLQVNGFGGVELRYADRDGYRRAAEALARHGATAVQPTFFSSSIAEYAAALEVLDQVRRNPPPGCRFLPAHLEGPFLSPEWVAAHRLEDFRDPDVQVLDRLCASGPVGFMTLAPELPDGLDLVRRLRQRGVVASIGHSDATASETRAAVDAGVRHLTHCWNAHRRLTSRDPGPAGVALTDPRVTVGLIPDLVHTAAEVVLLTFAAAAGRVAVTTDAIPPAGTEAKTWSEHGREVRVQAGAARLEDGTLAGSVATPIGLVRTLMDLGVTLADAVDACGGVQRRLLGMTPCRLRVGDPADVVVLDEDMSVRTTLVEGELVA